MKITDIGAAIPAAATLAVSNGHAPDRAARPYWQDQPCPSWCHMVVPHQDHNPPEDRFHLSHIHDVTLTLEAPDVLRFPDGSGGTVLEVSPSFVTASLLQGWREREARVSSPTPAHTTSSSPSPRPRNWQRPCPASSARPRKQEAARYDRPRSPTDTQPA